MNAPMIVVDAQVHAPDGRDIPIPGIDYEPLIRLMDENGVHRAVIVPVSHALVGGALALYEREPQRFAVMAPLPNDERLVDVAALEGLKETPGVAGIRISAYGPVGRAILTAAPSSTEWLFRAVGRFELHVAVNTLGHPELLHGIARSNGGTRFELDHMGLDPFRRYVDFEEHLDALLPLAGLENVAIKATCLPGAVDEPFPFPSVHEPLRRVIEAFTPRRVFWGSDLTRLPCSYHDCLRLFTEALGYLNSAELEEVMGRALLDWLNWR